MLARFFVDRPIFASVLSILIVLLGGVAYFRLPVEQYPELAPPVVRVEALYPGANAQIVADTIASIIEQEVNGVDNMIYMSSTSSDGRYALDVSFEPGTDVDMAAVLVQNRVGIAEPRLPEEARRLGITTLKQSTSLAGVIAIYPDDAHLEDYDDLFLSNYMAISIRDEIARVPGVGGVTIIPSKDYSMRVWLDPELLKARRLTVDDVAAAIRAQNVAVAAGVIGRQPAPQGQDFELIVTTKGRLTTPEEFGEIIIKSERSGATNAGAPTTAGIVRVRDVATIELGGRDYTTLATFNGRPTAVMPIYQLPGANLVATAAALEAKLESLRAEFPVGLDGKFFYDPSMFIRASLHEVTVTLIEAFVLVFLVVLVFLQSFRTTLIPALTIPVSLVGTFVVMALLGFSVNTLTMFGLVLAIGIVVDDAIVVVENVERNLAIGGSAVGGPGITPRQATLTAMSEITGPVIAITLVLMAVFIPAAAQPGITGQMYRQFALTIAASTFLSAVCALTLSPALCALLLRPHVHHENPSTLRRIVTFPARLFNRGFDALSRGYGRFAGVSIRLALLTLVIFVGVLVVTVEAYRRTPTGFVPDEDLGFVVVAATLPDGASLERTAAVIARVSEMARKIDGVADVGSLSGFSVLDGQGVSYGNAWIVLDPWDVRLERGRGIGDIIADLQTGVAPMQEAQFLVFSLPAINGLGNASGFEMRLQDRRSLGRDALEQAVGDVITAASSQSKIGVAFSSFRAGVPQLFLDIDREKAIRMGVPLTSVFNTLQTALGSSYVNDFNLFNRSYQVNAQAAARFRLTPEDIKRLEVRNADGAMLPLGTLLTVEDDIGPERVVRYNLYPSATINGIPAPGASSGEALRVMEGVATAALPPGMGFEWTAMAYQEKRAEGQGLMVFALGLLVVYLILAAQYESWTLPLAVVLSVPLVVIGAIIALRLRGLDNNVFTQIGLVLLIGLGAKNAILIVEFARTARMAGKGILESAVSAATTRFRPILMTSFAFILGVLPLVLAQGAGASGRRALGTALFGGMIGVTVLGLVFTPALYASVQWTSERVRGLVRRGGAPAPVSAPVQ